MNGGIITFQPNQPYIWLISFTITLCLFHHYLLVMVMNGIMSSGDMNDINHIVFQIQQTAHNVTNGVALLSFLIRLRPSFFPPFLSYSHPPFHVHPSCYHVIFNPAIVIHYTRISHVMTICIYVIISFHSMSLHSLIITLMSIMHHSLSHPN